MESPQFIREVLFSTPLNELSYLSNLPAVKYLAERKRITLKSKITFFVGENGTGKSTLLEAIAIAYGFNPEGGTRNFNFSTNNSHSELYNHLALSKTAFAKDGFFLRAESFYNVASYIDEINATHNYGETSLLNQSHGESFLALVQNRFSGNGLYILDEPEAALSPMRQLTLMAEIDALIHNNSQFIIATHSPLLIAFPKAQVLQFTQTGIEEVDYKDTEHYQVSKLFLENPDRILKYLLAN